MHTVAPAAEAMCAYFLLMDPPALKSAIVTPPKLHIEGVLISRGECLTSANIMDIKFAKNSVKGAAIAAKPMLSMAYETSSLRGHKQLWDWDLKQRKFWWQMLLLICSKSSSRQLLASCLRQNAGLG